ncbi:MAG: DUF6338 family protein [Gemmatimonadota bacterium]
MTSASLLVLLFVVVPGFMADSIYRLTFGERRLTDFERTVRSLIFSAFGLLAYLAGAQAVHALVGRVRGYDGLLAWIVSPPYLQALGDAEGKTGVLLGWTAFVPFVLHTVVTVLVALLWGWALSRPWVERWYSESTGRSTGGSAWQILWGRLHASEAPARWLTVRLSGGLRVMGRLQVADDLPDEKDIVLGDPWFWNEEKGDWFAENTRYIFIPAGKIESIALSPGGREVALTGFLGEMMATAHGGYTDDGPEEHGAQPLEQP